MKPRHLLAFFVLVLAHAGCRSDAPRASQSDAALFATQGVPALELFVDRGAMAELARQPRDFVPAALRLRAAGEPRYQNVALRFKGNRSLRTWADKPAFKLDFVKYQKGRRIFGLDGLALNNMVEDPTMLRENLGALVYDALGVPAPRVGYAEVFVNGQRYGLYSVLEPVDPRMLARELGSGDGLLYEGEFGCDLYEGDVFALAHERGEDPERTQLLALARAIAGPPERWLLGAQALMNRDAVLGFLAAGAFLGDFDGYRHAHNYRLYREPERGLWSLVPWGFDRILKKRLTVFDSNGRVALRCFGDRACRVAYVKVLRKAVATIEALGLARRLEALDARIAPALGRDRRRPYSRTKRARALEELRAFVRERPGEVRAEIACFDGTQELDRDGDGAGCLDCDDADPARHPGVPETCNGRDDDCSGLVDDHPSCPCAPLALPDRQLELCDLALAFDDAKAFCAARGQRLAHLVDLEDAKRVERAARALSKSQFWIGLDDLAHEGRYRFHTGDKPKAALWDDGEPDAYACGEHCAALKEKGRGKLRDLHCASRLPFLCEPLAAPESEGSLTPEKKVAEPVKEGNGAVH